jgi:GAF domain-containing protein
VSCPSCGLSTYCVSEADCPHCDARLRARTAPPAGPEPRRSHSPASAVQVRRALVLAREGVGADVVFLSEIHRGREVIHTTTQDDRLPHVRRGAAFPLEDTICQRMLEGRVGRVVPDVAAEPELAGLKLDGIGAYMGVPLSSDDARLFVLCCLSAEARPQLGDGDLRFLEGVAASLRSAIDADADLIASPYG